MTRNDINTCVDVEDFPREKPEKNEELLNW